MLMGHVRRIAIGFALLGVASWVAADAPAPSKAPRLEVVQDTVDLGEVTRGEVVVASYELRNVGDAPLRILKVNPG
jgi:hypothetical protein